MEGVKIRIFTVLLILKVSRGGDGLGGTGDGWCEGVKFGPVWYRSIVVASHHQPAWILLAPQRTN